MSEMKRLNKELVGRLQGDRVDEAYPVKVLQIGDGNFIRSFIDWMISVMNQKTDFNGRVATVQALLSDQATPIINRQDGLFTLLSEGNVDGEFVKETHLVDSIAKGFNPYEEWESLLKLVQEEQVEFLFSNTTEAGIVYVKEGFNPKQCPKSYPGKITSLLYHRYKYFEGDKNKGWTIIPCELIEDNGKKLKQICIQIATDWDLPEDFVKWLNHACSFCNTLVDRIVPGYPKSKAKGIYQELGYRDDLLTVAEPYHLFVIEGEKELESKLPLKEAGLNVKFDSINMYRELKVKLLNGAHTMLAPLGILCGIDIVSKGMKDKDIFQFINLTLREEIAVTLNPEIEAISEKYIEQMYDRFSNPYLNHKLTDISLNSYSKYKARVWPSLYAYMKNHERIPQRLTFSFATLLYFYRGVAEEAEYKIIDDEWTIMSFQEFYKVKNQSRNQIVNFIKKMIERDFLTTNEELPELYETIANYFILIDKLGMKRALTKLESRF